VNSLPKTVTQQRRDCDLNPGPTAPESSTLTTQLPSHDCVKCDLKLVAVAVVICASAGTHASDGNVLFIVRMSTLSALKPWTFWTNCCDTTTRTGSRLAKQWITHIFVSYSQSFVAFETNLQLMTALNMSLQ